MSERIEKIKSSKGTIFYMYYDGTTCYYNIKGKPKRVETYYYLDNEFNKLLTVCDENSLNKYLVLYRLKSMDVFVGPTSPLVREGDSLVLNTEEDQVGIWLKTSEEEKNKYKTLLEHQNEQELDNNTVNNNGIKYKLK